MDSELEDLGTEEDGEGSFGTPKAGGFGDDEEVAEDTEEGEEETE